MSLRSWFSQGCQLALLGLLILVGLIGGEGSNPTFAQVTEDPSLGTQVIPNGATLEITGGTTVGNTNLFHSFSNFNVQSEQVVDFRNASNINNILIRVTGGNPSNIQGLLKAQGRANLFLINPNGIVIGENASLDIGGSFIGTTANAIGFPGGGEFSITSPVNPLNPLLTVNPSAFLFNQIQSRPISSIQVDGAFLLMPNSQSLLLVGGDVKLKGGLLQTAGGQVELGGLAGEGTVGLNIDSSSLRLSFPDDVARADVSLTDAVRVIANEGNIQVQGRRITLSNRSTLEAKSARTLLVNASDLVELSEGSSLLTDTLGSESAGELRIETGQLIVKDGARASASTSGQGQGGTLSVTARDSIQLIGTSPGDENVPSGLFAVTDGTGDAGDLRIETGQLIVKDGAGISTSTSGQGQGGTLSVTARDSIQLIGTSITGQRRSGLLVGTTGSGNAGNLEIETGQLIARDGARISAATTSESTGQGGSIIVKTGQLNVLNGAEVIVNSQGPRNDAGSLTVQADSIVLNQGTLAGATASGRGGDISLQVKDLVLLRNGSVINTTADNDGSGGNITINAPNGFIVAVPNENSDITANAFNGSGGVIKINALNILNFTQRSREDLVRELGTNDPNQLKPQKLPTNDITAFSLTSPTLSGQITINTPDIEPNQGLVELPIALVDASGIIDTSCAAFADSESSEFIITGRGGLPSSPDDPLSTDVVWSDTRIPKTTAQRSQITTKSAAETNVGAIVPATGWMFNGKGEVTLISHAAGATNLGSTSATCHKQ